MFVCLNKKNARNINTFLDIIRVTKSLIKLYFLFLAKSKNINLTGFVIHIERFVYYLLLFYLLKNNKST
jgi:hypothetical protein